MGLKSDLLPAVLLLSIAMQVRQQALEEERLRKEREDEEAKALVFILVIFVMANLSSDFFLVF